MMFMVNAVAQDDSGSGGNFKPAAGDFSGAIMFGRSMGQWNLTTPYSPTRGNVPSGSSWNVYGVAPQANGVNGTSNSIANMVGAEVRYFLSGQIAVKASGFGIIRNTPPRDNMQGIVAYDMPNAGWIPDYQAVKAYNRVDMNINLGGEYHFNGKFDRVDPWFGVTVPFYYGRQSEYDPGVTMYDLGGSDPEIWVHDVGPRHGELIAFGGSAVGGIDFYLMEGMFVGLEIKPVSYVYAYMLQYPAPGLPTMGSDTHTFSFMSQPLFKLGFRF